MKRPFKDISGQRFRRLVATSRAGDEVSDYIIKGGEIVTCAKCGGAAMTKDCRSGFEPSIQSLTREAADELERLQKTVDVLRRAKNDVERRYLPCPDHRDKHQTGDECLMCQRERLRAEIERLGKLVYLPGHWSCPKCNFYLVSTNIHVPSGGFSANAEPQQCANGCGPMWRVTHEQSANTMVELCEKLQEKLPCGHRKVDMDDSYGGCAFCGFSQGYEEYEQENTRLARAIAWALGYTDFRARADGEGAYWWRTELRERSGLSHEDLQAEADTQAAPCANPWHKSDMVVTAFCTDCGETIEAAPEGK